MRTNFRPDVLPERKRYFGTPLPKFRGGAELKIHFYSERDILCNFPKTYVGPVLA